MCSLSKHCEVAEIVAVLVAFGNGGGRGDSNGSDGGSGEVMVLQVVVRVLW